MTTPTRTLVAVASTSGLEAPNDHGLVTRGYLRQTFDYHDNNLRSLFQGQHDYHKEMYRRIADQFSAVDKKFEAVDKKFEAVGERFDSVEDRLDSFITSYRNRLVSRPYQFIHDPRSRKHPAHFPATVAMFWSLKKPENLWKLASLLDDYEFRGYGAWDEYDEHGYPLTNPMPQLKLFPSNETPTLFCVRRHVEMAHLALAEILGLDYNAIEDNMRRLETYLQGSASPRHPTKSKRQDDDAILGRKSKSARPEPISDCSSLTEEIHRGPTGQYRQTHISSTLGHTTSLETEPQWAPLSFRSASEREVEKETADTTTVTDTSSEESSSGA